MRTFIQKVIRLFRPRKKVNKLKKSLIITKSNNTLSVSGELNGAYKAKELWMAQSLNQPMIRLAEIPPSSEFTFDVDLHKHETKLVQGRYGFYVLIRVAEEDLSENKRENLKNNSTAKEIQREDGGVDIEYLIRLGKFAHTKFEAYDPFIFQEQKGYVYINRKGFITLALDVPINIKPKAKIYEIKSVNDHFYMKGEILSEASKINRAEFILIGRESGLKYRVPVRVDFEREKSEEKCGHHYFLYHGELQLKTIADGKPLNEDIYDLYLNFELNNQPEAVIIRLGKPSYHAKRYSKPAQIGAGKSIFTATPYFTIKHFNLSLQIDEFDRETFWYLKKMMKWAWLLRIFYKRNDIWLVGERPYKAQDTGYHFFKYMRTHHPERNVYYIIEKNSPEVKSVEPLGNLLYFGTKKHIKYTLIATRIFGSHHSDYLYPMRVAAIKKKIKAKKIFLQHGVIGTKNTVHFYGVHSPSFHTDLFIVSSDYEKEIIRRDFGYDTRQVKVTGLSRFDSLLAGDVLVKRQLLVIPTWREWIVNDEKFLESEYFARYRELVHHPYLHELSKNLQFEIVLCLHPNMQMFTSFFKDAPVRIVNQGEIDVQYLLKESAMMITDYSSVAFDFSFLHKPVVYYQFDRERFIGKKQSHLDLDLDLPGEIVYEIADILKLVESYAQHDFTMKPEYMKRASKFLKYRDQNASKRIYEAALHIPHIRQPLIKRVARNRYAKAIYRRFRKGRFYYPVMKALYNIARRVLLVDEQLMVFESGVGKQYSDSPRYIYEEIVKRKLPYKKVWVYNKKIRFKDRKTIIVKRLSPKYYYYLAKARYWVNNQNFPTYMKKRPETTYLQTWHGTPLKKMLFDIENVQGRTDDYVERVYGATKTWDYLVSPSPYATEAFKSAFHYEGNILEVGYPRNDLFYHKDKERVANKTKSVLKIQADKKVILYAPTFRDNQTKGGANKFSFDIQLDLEKMKQALGDEYVLLLRMHVVIKNKIKIPAELRDFVLNVSNYPDIQELYLITDILITDYSSVMFDFANTKRPILFFTYDLEFYRDELRGFYFDLENKAPGPLLKTTDELITAMKSIEKVQEEYKEKYDQFYHQFCSLEDGHATERVVDAVLGERHHS
ncbi:CDP-glycerol glycerophosphotransferase family protein [Cytobacillus sp. Hz8]|uniref:CDP-glycerol glycerophosphotransferase family protein n=1 Tax=Cytobacillus sp. Hz8 TaxID=3347168 RepID=UPI0035DF02D7